MKSKWLNCFLFLSLHVKKLSYSYRKWFCGNRPWRHDYFIWSYLSHLTHLCYRCQLLDKDKWIICLFHNKILFFMWFCLKVLTMTSSWWDAMQVSCLSMSFRTNMKQTDGVVCICKTSTLVVIWEMGAEESPRSW